jgi:LPS export ABC transporter protein LptC
MLTTKRVKYILWSIMFLTTATVLCVFAGYRYFVKNPAALLPVIASQADMTLGKIEHVATQNGIEQWRLSAKTGHVIDARKEAILDDLSVVYFLKDGGKIYLSATHGVLKTDTKNMEARGKVVVRNKRFRLETEHLSYNHKTRKLFARSPVKIFSQKVIFTSKTMAIDLNSQLASLKGNVKGILYEKLAL